jgi:hypothetical protein
LQDRPKVTGKLRAELGLGGGPGACPTTKFGRIERLFVHARRPQVHLDRAEALTPQRLRGCNKRVAPNTGNLLTSISVYSNPMSNIAGKAYAMNVITPLPWYDAWISRLIFKVAALRPSTTIGLVTLSLIHYARWVIVRPKDFPRLSPDQPAEELRYNYMLFFSNFNGSWDQYVDSFSSAISGGLNLFWRKNVKYPGSVPMLPFHRYITSNQIWTDYYYNAYPMASANDVKSARTVSGALGKFIADTKGDNADAFRKKYNTLLLELQHDLGTMGPNQIVSLSAWAVENRLATERAKLVKTQGATS